VFEFTDTIVREIMVPRTAIHALDVDTRSGDLLRVVSEMGRSRIPVNRGSIDRPVGTLVINDLLAAAARGAIPPLADMVHPTVFVPETAKITALLQEFRRRRQGLALVVDEYGTVVGVVTIEDVIEEIFGRIGDERVEDEHRWFVSLEADGTYVIDGIVPIDEVNERLALAFERSPEYQTVAGLLIDTLEAIPTAGTTVERRDTDGRSSRPTDRGSRRCGRSRATGHSRIRCIKG
jgi:putative hemolysin